MPRKDQSEIRYLSPVDIDKRRKEKYCRFKKWESNILTIKTLIFLMRFLNEQGKILPRRITGTSLKYQRRLSTAIKRCRQLALLPYVADNLK